jgi:hypothetical protein
LLSGVPRLTVRRLMFYVVLVAVALKLATVLPDRIEDCFFHWTAWSKAALEERTEAQWYARHAASVAPNQIVGPCYANVRDESGRIVRYTGRVAATLARYHESVARICEAHRCRVWAVQPPPIPSPPFR